MEKQGIPPSDYDSPPPPYFLGPAAAAAEGGQSTHQPVESYVSDNQKTPLCPIEDQSYPAEPYSAQPYPIQTQGYPTGPYCTQPVGYGQQQQAVVFMHPTPLADPPQDYLGYSIFVTVCCCWLIGIFAIMKATECRSAVAVGDRAKAELKSKEARNLANIGLGLGIACLVVAGALYGVYFGLILHR